MKQCVQQCVTHDSKQNWHVLTVMCTRRTSHIHTRDSLSGTKIHYKSVQRTLTKTGSCEPIVTEMRFRGLGRLLGLRGRREIQLDFALHRV